MPQKTWRKQCLFSSHRPPPLSLPLFLAVSVLFGQWNAQKGGKNRKIRQQQRLFIVLKMHTHSIGQYLVHTGQNIFCLGGEIERKTLKMNRAIGSVVTCTPSDNHLKVSDNKKMASWPLTSTSLWCFFHHVSSTSLTTSPAQDKHHAVSLTWCFGTVLIREVPWLQGWGGVS